MVKVFILLGLFIIVVYIYTFTKMKKSRKKTNNINTVQDFHENYQHLINRRQLSDKTKIQQNNSESYRKYVTKYNSSEDYREK